MKTNLLLWGLLGILVLVFACQKTDTVIPSSSTTTSSSATTGTSTPATSTTVTSSTVTSSSATVIKIPDPNFEQALIDLGVDSDKTVNGQISQSDALKVSSINIAFKSISDLTGIEGFTKLTALMCGYNKLTTLNVSANTALMKLVCHYNSLSGKLDLKGLKLLSSLDATGNANLTTICVSDIGSATTNTNFQKDATAVYSVCP